MTEVSAHFSSSTLTLSTSSPTANCSGFVNGFFPAGTFGEAVRKLLKHFEQVQVSF